MAEPEPDVLDVSIAYERIAWETIRIVVYRDGDRIRIRIGGGLGIPFSRELWDRYTVPLTAQEAAQVGRTLLELSEQISREA